MDRRAIRVTAQTSMLGALALFGWKAGARFAQVTGRPQMGITWSWFSFAVGVMTIPAALLLVTVLCLIFRIDPEPDDWRTTSGVDL